MLLYALERYMFSRLPVNFSWHLAHWKRDYCAWSDSTLAISVQKWALDEDPVLSFALSSDHYSLKRFEWRIKFTMMIVYPMVAFMNDISVSESHCGKSMTTFMSFSPYLWVQQRASKPAWLAQNPNATVAMFNERRTGNVHRFDSSNFERVFWISEDLWSLSAAWNHWQPILIRIQHRKDISKDFKKDKNFLLQYCYWWQNMVFPIRSRKASTYKLEVSIRADS